MVSPPPNLNSEQILQYIHKAMETVVESKIAKPLEEIRLNIRELELELKSFRVQFKDLSSDHKNLEKRMILVERYMDIQNTLNEGSERESRHRWTKIMALILAFEVVGIAAGLVISLFMR